MPVPDDEPPTRHLHHADCPCGCGASLMGMVAEREAGLRADAVRETPLSMTRERADGQAAAFLLTGMPGAGKSTVARLMALRFDKAAHVDIDVILHHFTVSGLEPPDARTAESSRQEVLAVANAAAIARNYVDAGYFCVLDGAIARRDQIRICAETLAPHPLHLVVLAPPLETSERRDRDRSGKHVAGHFRYLHPQLRDELGDIGLWLDTAGQTPRETATAVLAQRADAALPLPG